jgi:hypothetical protein
MYLYVTKYNSPAHYLIIANQKFKVADANIIRLAFSFAKFTRYFKFHEIFTNFFLLASYRSIKVTKSILCNKWNCNEAKREGEQREL